MAVGRSRLMETRSAPGKFTNGTLGVGYGVGRIQHRIFMECRYHDDTVRISPHKIAWKNTHPANGYGHLQAVDLHAVLSRSHPMRACKNRVAILAAKRDIAADAIDHRPTQLPTKGDLCENIAPHGAILPATIVQHQDHPGRHIVDVVAHRAGRLGGRLVSDRECATGQLEVLPARRDFRALSRDPQPIERIAQGRAIERFQSLLILLGIHEDNMLS